MTIPLLQMMKQRQRGEVICPRSKSGARSPTASSNSRGRGTPGSGREGCDRHGPCEWSWLTRAPGLGGGGERPFQLVWLGPWGREETLALQGYGCSPEQRRRKRGGYPVCRTGLAERRPRAGEHLHVQGTSRQSTWREASGARAHFPSSGQQQLESVLGIHTGGSPPSRGNFWTISTPLKKTAFSRGL